jgi:hypothetical protein
MGATAVGSEEAEPAGSGGLGQRRCLRRLTGVCMSREARCESCCCGIDLACLGRARSGSMRASDMAPRDARASASAAVGGRLSDRLDADGGAGGGGSSWVLQRVRAGAGWRVQRRCSVLRPPWSVRGKEAGAAVPGWRRRWHRSMEVCCAR